MKWITHKSMVLVPLVITDIEIDYFTKHLWKTSKSIKKYKLSRYDLIQKNHASCRLDPGGMLNTREKWVQFQIDTFKFEIQLSKIEWVILKIKKSKERIPRCKRIKLFNYHLIVSIELENKLLEKLNELQKSDASIHAHIDDAESKAKLESTGFIVFPEILREPGNN